MAGWTLRYEEHNEERESFENYLERFEFFVTTNAVSAGLMLSSVGAQAFIKIKSQLKPENMTDKIYHEVVAAAPALYKQQLAVIGRRNQYMNRNRKPSESVSQYAVAVQLQRSCGWITRSQLFIRIYCLIVRGNGTASTNQVDNVNRVQADLG